ncbi:hypothetical protein E2542_SST07018 [Spatholobus suberectus]|nr:hypothetical protein E2542_SST07018 [Spatholobus suberectus]
MRTASVSESSMPHELALASSHKPSSSPRHWRYRNPRLRVGVFASSRRHHDKKSSTAWFAQAFGFPTCLPKNSFASRHRRDAGSLRKISWITAALSRRRGANLPSPQDWGNLKRIEPSFFLVVAWIGARDLGSRCRRTGISLWILGNFLGIDMKKQRGSRSPPLLWPSYSVMGLAHHHGSIND